MGKINKSIIFWVACLVFSVCIYVSYVSFSIKTEAKFSGSDNYSSTYITGRSNSKLEENLQKLLKTLKKFNSSAIVYPRDGTPFIYIYETPDTKSNYLIKGSSFTEADFNNMEAENNILVPSDTGLEYYFSEGESFPYLDKNYRAIGVLDKNTPYLNRENKVIAPLSKMEAIHSSEWYFSSTDKDFLDTISDILSKASSQEVSVEVNDVTLFKSIILISLSDKWGLVFLLASISSLLFLLIATELEIRNNQRRELIKFALGASKKGEYKFFIFRRLKEIFIGSLGPILILLVLDILNVQNGSINFFYIDIKSLTLVLILILVVIVIDSIMYFSLSFKRNGERL